MPSHPLRPPMFNTIRRLAECDPEATIELRFVRGEPGPNDLTPADAVELRDLLPMVELTTDETSHKASSRTGTRSVA